MDINHAITFNAFMTHASYLILGFNALGPLMEKTLSDAKECGIDARYHQLNGTFQTFAHNGDAWNDLDAMIKDHNEAYVIWAGDAIIAWDRLERALDLNHRPDFLWPAALELHNGAINPVKTELFKACGAFEIALFGFHELVHFHHCVHARALHKLLSIADINKLSVTDYLMKAWENFESVKAPDGWLIPNSQTAMKLSTINHLFNAEQQFEARHNNWLMGRNALEAKTRNTMAAADFCRANQDIMHPVMPGLMNSLPYYGFWLFKAGQKKVTMQPVHGHHPAVSQAIWVGDYCAKALDYLAGLFCMGNFGKAVDMRSDGHIFGLCFSKITGLTCDIVTNDLSDSAHVQSAIDCNHINTIAVKTASDNFNPDKNILLFAEIKNFAQYAGQCDIFVPLSLMDNRDAIIMPQTPKDYQIFIANGQYSGQSMSLDPYSNQEQLTHAAGIIIIHQDHVSKMGRQS